MGRVDILKSADLKYYIIPQDCKMYIYCRACSPCSTPFKIILQVRYYNEGKGINAFVFYLIFLFFTALNPKSHSFTGSSFRHPYIFSRLTCTKHCLSSHSRSDKLFRVQTERFEAGSFDQCPSIYGL